MDQAGYMDAICKGRRLASRWKMNCISAGSPSNFSLIRTRPVAWEIFFLQSVNVRPVSQGGPGSAGSPPRAY